MDFMDINELVKLSNRYGNMREFVLAGGGNTSIKNGDYLYIKGSGCSLADIDENGFVKMARDRLDAIWEKAYSSDPCALEAEVLADIMDARAPGEHMKRPSVEVLLHNIFPQKFVLHVHHTLLNGMTCSVNFKDAVERLFGESAGCVPVIRPGYNLAVCVKKVAEKYKAMRHRDLNVLFVENHGVFFAAKSVKELDTLVEGIITAARNAVKTYPDFSPADVDSKRAASLAPAIRMLTKAGASSIVTFRTNREMINFCGSANTFAPLALAYTPDQIVYCMDEALFVGANASLDAQFELLERSIKEYAAKKGCAPKIIAVQGLGFYACGKDKRDADIAADMFLDTAAIIVYAKSFGGAKPLDGESVRFITGWEVEKYRKKVSLGVGNADGIAERIAIITGGAQGFGKGIAECLAAKGLNIVIADLNEVGAAAAAAELKAKYGSQRVIVVQTDVSDEAATDHLMIRTSLEYGGLDLYINNAGINKPGGLEEMDVTTFEKINKVNYTAYFIGVKYASCIMKIQHRYDPGHFMDIIQINSKSGISGSNKNFAYAGSKFAGIGLTQSFALELVEYNIKVNAICPGNFFDGPLWSDPKNGMFVQYLEKGKVPGAKTVEDVRRFYESKVPMLRGCRAEDVARAVVYLVEQVYETGQAVPVTGGQQMLK
jgi:rhamnose utilization protein RhaD (predicted bifunctional aldolase and dehydrogenase)/NAD(P)-dependent dehydrogenase (short-subunit alcohol dehydrogenase family)